ncbi:hypothetical protein HOD19_01820 [bacterium]|jgi:hypothetical protein|nr:hypothetical protein [bacterium]
MTTNTAQKIVNFVRKNKSVRPNDLVSYLEISKQAVFRQLKKLLEQEILSKTGTPPNVFYTIKTFSNFKNITISDKNNADIIEKNYLFITPNGDFLAGVKGFNYWCEHNNLPVEKTVSDYVKTLDKYNKFKNNETGLISGLEKFKQSFEQVYIDQVYYLDFYSIERFGKTKLGSLLLYAKQSQNRELINKIFQIIEQPVLNLIKIAKIDAVSFVPPTVARNIQLQKELEKKFSFKLPKINIVKVNTEITVPQKTLSKLKDRINNVDKTIFLGENKVFNNILLIDDAVGSGATFNQIAKKIREKKLVKGKIIGLALTGSFKGFDVISEV